MLRDSRTSARSVTLSQKSRVAQPAMANGTKAAADTGTAEIKISAADPLNLVGVILPGARVPSTSTEFLVFRNGVVVNAPASHKELVAARSL